MAQVESNVIRPEAMSGMALDKNYLEENCKFPDVQMRQKNPADASETQRKKRARNRLSNRRSTGFVYEDQIKEALEMGPPGNAQTAGNQ